MSAPEAAVAAVMEALGCARRSVGELGFCSPHWQMTSYTAWTDRGCPVAVAAADAAVDAARPSIEAEALREAADELGEGDGISRFIGMDPLPQAVRAEKRAQAWLRARADRIEGEP